MIFPTHSPRPIPRKPQRRHVHCGLLTSDARPRTRRPHRRCVGKVGRWCDLAPSRAACDPPPLQPPTLPSPRRMTVGWQRRAVGRPTTLPRPRGAGLTLYPPPPPRLALNVAKSPWPGGGGFFFPRCELSGRLGKGPNLSVGRPRPTRWIWGGCGVRCRGTACLVTTVVGGGVNGMPPLPPPPRPSLRRSAPGQKRQWIGHPS